VIKVPVGPCHGDLTLSNIILSPTTGVILIDFLDTFIDSPLQDVAKLNQDFLCGWSFRNAPAAVQVKASLFTKAAYPKFAIEITKSYKRQVDLFTIMSLARIAPYIKDVITEQWLISQLNKKLDEAVL
jgi:Ser/Thr protein kinase RdoA (MazF antagonist)